MTSSQFLRQPSSKIAAQESGWQTQSRICNYNSDAELQPSILVELAYEEFCSQRDQGNCPDPEDFLERFASVREPLEKLFVIDELIEAGEISLPWSGQDPPDAPKEGDQLFQCKLIRLIGRGGFSRVFHAKQNAIGERDVALKVSATSLCDAAFLGRLSHPSIVRVHSVHHDVDRRLYGLVMELIAGPTLASLQAMATDTRGRSVRCLEPKWKPLLKAKNPLSKLGQNLALRLTDGVAYLWEKHVFHADIKPENILINSEGYPKLIDFNLAVKQDARFAEGGTLAYMAPEQLEAVAAGRPVPISFQTELYSLATVLIEHFCGRRHIRHSFASLPETAKNLLEARGRRFWLSRTDRLPSWCREPLRKSVACCPDGRLGNAFELLEEFRFRLRRSRITRRTAVVSCSTITAATLLAPAISAARGFWWPTVAERFKTANKLLNQGDFAESGRVLRGIPADAFSSHDLAIAAGLDQMQLNHFHNAVSIFERSMKLAPARSPVTSLLFGYAQAKAGHDLTGAMYNLAFAINSTDGAIGTQLLVETRNNYAVVLAWLGRNSQADREIATAYEEIHRDPTAFRDGIYEIVARNYVVINYQHSVDSGLEPRDDLIRDVIKACPDDPLLALLELCIAIRNGRGDSRQKEIEAALFRQRSDAPFFAELTNLWMHTPTWSSESRTVNRQSEANAGSRSILLLLPPDYSEIGFFSEKL